MQVFSMFSPDTVHQRPVRETTSHAMVSMAATMKSRLAKLSESNLIGLTVGCEPDCGSVGTCGDLSRRPWALSLSECGFPGEEEALQLWP